MSPLNHRGFWLDAVAKIATGQEHTGLSRSKQQHLVAVVQERHIQSMRETNLVKYWDMILTPRRSKNSYGDQSQEVDKLQKKLPSLE